MVPLRGAFNRRNVHRAAPVDARMRHTRNHACFSAKNVALNACVCRPVPMVTSSSVRVTTTGRPREEDLSAHE
ncbi:hypothetical protein GIB67_038103 [Kingdonia uniflora]|uniref:Uncharacterized protein n=1 Tax=Kingdonia uniflora TaxID=39325 RepID=A0A7J7P7W6_9MAGN|nr:hypothetical protein GIB67_038103 [Kingdonia uniflora]